MLVSATSVVREYSIVNHAELSQFSLHVHIYTYVLFFFLLAKLLCSVFVDDVVATFWFQEWEAYFALLTHELLFSDVYRRKVS